MTAKPRQPLRPRFTAAAKFTVLVAGEKEGSGVVIAESGIILTAYHVVRDAERITVRRCRIATKERWQLEPMKRVHEADLLFVDKRMDIAVLKLRKPPKTLAAAALGNSTKLAIGTALYRIGDDNNGNHFTDGWLFEFQRVYRMLRFHISMGAGEGGSGGPVIDKHCRLVGILVRGQRNDDSIPGYSQAIPINAIKRRVLRQPSVKGAMSAASTPSVTKPEV
jgi:S1-C subfamily serine protease